MRLPRPLDPVEVRVLGCLLEKQQTTPEYYPLTLNSLVAACNQKSNRDPVMELDEMLVRGALERLRDEVLVWPATGSRVERWEHNLDRRWALDAGEKAVIAVLLLRGAQTPGELRGRTERMRPFASLAEIELVLVRLASGEAPLVVELHRAPGQSQRRFMHLAGGPVSEVPDAARSAPVRPVLAGPPAEGLSERVASLEAEVACLAGEVARLAAIIER